MFLSPKGEPLIILQGAVDDVVISRAMQKILDDPYGEKAQKKIDDLQKNMEQTQQNIKSGNNINQAKEFLQDLIKKKELIETSRQQQEKERKISDEKALKSYKDELENKIKNAPVKTISKENKEFLDKTSDLISKKQYIQAGSNIRSVFFEIYMAAGQKTTGSKLAQELFGYIDKIGVEEIYLLEKKYEDKVLEFSVIAEELLNRLPK